MSRLHDDMQDSWLNVAVPSTQDKRNHAGAQYVEDKWRTIFNIETGTDPIAKGTWSTTEEDPSYKGGYRRYGAAKLCQAMMM